jgi:YbgC/YbaW family acyl-CoA thioester hydrolase
LEHKHNLRVRFNECDMYGHVNNAVYLSYLEHARVDLLKDIGLPLESLTESGIFLYIVKISIEYKKPAKIDDLLEIRTKYVKRIRTGGTFNQVIYRGKDLIADAIVKWVSVDRIGKPVRLPRFLAEFGL